MKYRVLFLSFFLVSYVFSASVYGEDFKTITTQELAKGIQNDAFELIDCDSELIYKKTHIPTAVRLDITAPDIKVLPKDKSRPLVFYCKNPRCSASHQGATFASRKGYTNISIYPDGIDGWIQAKQKVVGGS